MNTNFLLVMANPFSAAVYTSLKCLPFGNWVFEHGSCVALEHYSSQEEAESICKRYLGAEVQKAQNPLHVVRNPVKDLGQWLVEWG